MPLSLRALVKNAMASSSSPCVEIIDLVHDKAEFCHAFLHGLEKFLLDFGDRRIGGNQEKRGVTLGAESSS